VGPLALCGLLGLACAPQTDDDGAATEDDALGGEGERVTDDSAEARGRPWWWGWGVRDAGVRRDAGPPPSVPADAGTTGPQPVDAGQPVADAGRPLADAAVPPTQPSAGGCKVVPVPEALRAQRKIPAFYKKHADANGIPILSSEKPIDKTLTLACELVNELVGERPDVRDALIRNRAQFIIIASSEKTTDPPEYSHLPDYYNTRARGLGGLVGMCAEESILCDRSKDRWYGESICVHEFAHTVALYGLYAADKTFESRLNAAFQSAKSAGLWRNTYASEQPQEYWAEGVQSWYDTNLESAVPNGVHGPIDTKSELREYDRKLYDLVDELLPDDVKWNDCYRGKQ